MACARPYRRRYYQRRGRRIGSDLSMSHPSIAALHGSRSRISRSGAASSPAAGVTPLPSPVSAVPPLRGGVAGLWGRVFLPRRVVVHAALVPLAAWRSGDTKFHGDSNSTGRTPATSASEACGGDDVAHLQSSGRARRRLQSSGFTAGYPTATPSSWPTSWSGCMASTPPN